MKNVGFDGGSFLCELGPAADISLFFECVSYVAKLHPEHDFSLLTDRLYRRYLRQEDLDEASKLMSLVKLFFQSMPSSTVDWEAAVADGLTQTRLNPNDSSLAEVFSKYFAHFERCVQSAKNFYENWKIYQPVKTVISDLPDFMTDKKRPLEQYETLEGKPFWLR